MNKVSRTFRIDRKLSKKLDKLTKRPYTYTWHLEKALEAYLALEDVKAAARNGD